MVKKAVLIVVVVTKMTFDTKLNDNKQYAPYDWGLVAENLLLQAIKEGQHIHT